jgi:2,5-furandicarboxylate decarboxylase 1
MSRLEESGQLLRIRERVSPKYEIASIMSEFSETPFLFENVDGHHGFSVCGNLFSTRKLLAESVRLAPEDIYKKINYALSNPLPCKVDSSNPWDLSSQADLSNLPIMTHYAAEAGPYITAGIVFAKVPNSEAINLSVHRMQVLGKDKATARVVPRHLYQISKDCGGEIPIALVNGVEPEVFLASSLQPQFGISEIEVANSLAEGKIKLYELENGIRVPVESEIVLEGRLSIDEQVEEGPFVDLTGTYDDIRFQPSITFTRMYTKRNPIYHSVLAASPEHKIFMSLPQELKVLDALSKSMPRIRGINFTDGGCGYFHCIVSIEKNNDGDGKTAIMNCFAASHSLKLVIAVDTDVDPFNWDEVEWALATRFQASKGMVLIDGARGSTLDPSSGKKGITSKLGLDATLPVGANRYPYEKAKVIVTENVRGIIKSLERVTTRAKN